MFDFLIYMCLCLLFNIPICVNCQYTSTNTDWLNWKQHYAPNTQIIQNYNDTIRYEIFKINIDFINSINNANLSYSLAPSKFADLTFEEFKFYIINNANCGLNSSFDLSIQPISSNRKLLYATGLVIDNQNSNENMAAEIDYSNYFSNLQNSTIVETKWDIIMSELVFGLFNIFLNSGNAKQLQNINAPNFGTFVNNTECSFNTISIISKDITIQLPYNNQISTLVLNGVFIKNITALENPNQYLMRELQTQPLMIFYNTNSRHAQFYNSGVYVNTCIDSQIYTYGSYGSYGSYGLLVGYGFDSVKNMEYWKIKTSWSLNWGENSYIRLYKSNCTNILAVLQVNTNSDFSLNVSDNPGYTAKIIVISVVSFIIIAMFITASVLMCKTPVIPNQ